MTKDKTMPDMPNLIYASVPEPNVLSGWWPNDPEHTPSVPYARIPEGIKPDDAVVISKAVNKAFGKLHQADLQLKSDAEQKLAALVELLKRVRDNAWPHAQREGADLLRMDLNDIDEALAQQAQPAGEWITINEDGSNLPEHVEGAEWFCEAEYRGREVLSFHPSDGTTRHPGGFGKWDDDLDCFVYMGVQPVAYWSVPYIDRRPDIPVYTAPSERTE